MKKINELVTKTEKPEHKSKRRAVTFGSFKRAEEKQIQERKDREHQEELARIAEDARIQKAIADEEARVIKEENTRKRNELITKKLSNAFGTKTDVDFKPVREQVIDKYLPQLREQETLDDYPKPFEAEPALNRELAEFKKKINEHLHKVGFSSSSGGGAGSFADLDDVDPTTAKVDGKTIQFDSSTNKFVGADVTAGALAADNLTAGDAAINLTTTAGNITIDAQGNNTDIIFKGTDGSSDTTFLTIDGSEAGAATFNAGIVIADAGNIGSASDTDAIAIASNGVVTFSQAPVFPDGSIVLADIDIDGGTDVGADLVDADLVVVDDGAGGTNRKSELTRIKKYIFSALSGDATASDAGALTIANTSIENGMLAGSIANSKLSNSSITVSDGSSTTAVSLGGTITFAGTSNEVEVGESSGTITVGLPNDVTIAGDLTVNGDTVTVNTATLSVEDPLIILANGNNSADSNDIGFYGLYDTSGSQDLYAGLFRDANDSGKFKLFKDLQAAPTTTVNTSGTGYAVGTIVANLEGNVVVPDAGNIGSASDTDAISIASDGDVTFTQEVELTNAGDAILKITADTDNSNENDTAQIILSQDGGATTGHFHLDNTNGLVINNASTAPGTTKIQNQGNTAIEIASTTIVEFKDDIFIKDGGTIGSSSDKDALSISAGGVVNFTQSPTVSSAAIKVAGKETIYVPASAMYPTTTSGCADLTQVEISSSQPELKVLDFDPSSDENAQFSVAFPKSWNEGVITFRAFFTVTGTNTGTVSWALSGVSMGDNDAIGAGFGTAVAPTAKAHSGTSNDINITAESGNVTISNAAVDEMVFFNVLRDVSADNQTGDARLIGIQIFYTTDAANDA